MPHLIVSSNVLLTKSCAENTRKIISNGLNNYRAGPQLAGLCAALIRMRHPISTQFDYTNRCYRLEY